MITPIHQPVFSDHDILLSTEKGKVIFFVDFKQVNMFKDFTFGNVLQFLDNEEILQLIPVCEGWYSLITEYIKNWRVLDCGKDQDPIFSNKYI